MKKQLPVYEMLIDEQETFVHAIALVEDPAIESDFMTFSKDSKEQIIADTMNECFNSSKVMNDDKMEILGAIMIPEKRMYRITNGKEYEVYWSKETCNKSLQTLSRKGLLSNLNLNHTDEKADAFVFQSMIIDRTMNVAPLDVPDGSVAVVVKVNSPELWKDIKAGKFKGFSVEGFFQLKQQEFSNQKDEMSEVLQLIETIKNELLKHNN